MPSTATEFRCLILVLGTLLAPACGRRQAPPQAPVSIRASGAWALYPMLVKWGAEYQKLHPEVRIDVSAGGAGKGIADCLAGLVDLGMVSRDVQPEEIRRGAVFVPVVKDAVLPVMNAANPLLAQVQRRGLGRAALARAWQGGPAPSWGDLAGTAQPLKVQAYTRSDACGAAETWAQYLGGRQEDLQGIGVFGDPGLADAVRRDVAGIGYNNLNFVFDPGTGRPVQGLAVVPLQSGGKVLALASKAEAIAAIRTGAYPAPPARALYLVTRKAFLGPAGAFVRWILADGQAFVDGVGYVRLSPAQLSAARNQLR